MPIIWREHCIECSMPLCYQSCSLYEKRKDDRCLRLEHGIVPYKFNNCVGANIHFKKWAKLEAIFSNSHSVASINSINILNIILTRFAILINALSIFIGNYRLNQIYERLHELSILFIQKVSLNKDDFNNFYMEAYNNENESFQMNFEIFQDNYTTSRTVIDDSAFERKEIKSRFPQVRVFDAIDIGEILNLDEFNVKVSDESKLRRKKYIDESKRKIIEDSYGNDYYDFLKTCELNIQIKNIFDKKNQLRCLELIQRSNQYNLSTTRYSNEEFNVLIENPKYLKYSIQVSDKFGDYGIVGFVSIQVSGQYYKITDFVLSCRVAQKMIEETFILWLGENIGPKAELEIKGYKTKQNSPLIKTIKNIGLNITEDSEAIIILKNKTSDSVFQKSSFINIELLNDKNE